jgi:hypothetical protein
MGFAGYNATLAPPIPGINSQQKQVTTNEAFVNRSLVTHIPRPASVSRESSYHSSSRPSSRPGTPRAARPRSQYPDGDFRNSSLADLVELKADVMCNWLHQQQIEKMWSGSGRGEGVMLKKARDDYMCCPKDLQVERDGLFDAVMKLNVKVSVSEKFEYISRLICLTFPVRNDSQHSHYKALPTPRRSHIRSSRRWLATTDPIYHQPAPSMPKTPLRSLHTRPGSTDSMG